MAPGLTITRPPGSPVGTAPRLLFASHDASRTGAPLALLHLLEWRHRPRLAANAQVLLLRGGPLAEEVPPCGRHARPASRPFGLGRSGRRPTPQSSRCGASACRASPDSVGRAELATARWRSGKVDLAFLNTVSSLELVDVLPPATVTVAWIHELDGVVEDSIGAERARLALQRCNHVLAASHSVRRFLEADLGVDPARCSTQHPFIPDEDGRRGTDRLRSAAELRRMAGIAPDAPLVGTIGAVSWRKGTDLLVLAAKVLVDHPAGAHVVVIGGAPDPTWADQVRRDVHDAGLAGRFHFVGEVDDTAAWHHALDVLVVPSREDPYPLAVLEAGRHGTPVVAFGSVATELLSDGRGTVAPAADPVGLATAVASVLDDLPGARAQASTLRDRVLTRHTASAAGPQLWTEILNVLAASRADR